MGRVVGFSAHKRKRSTAVVFVILLGLIGLMADIATEGSRSSMGTYLGLLGASAVTVGFIAGLSELLGYSLRIVFGRLTDHTGNYWAPLFIGYGINLIAVPALALTGNWMEAMWLIMLERLGRAVRSPARDAMLSHAGSRMGRGWAYGVQEALSSVGGMVGPVAIVVVMMLGGNYRLGFEVLLIPALAAVLLLVYARRVNPHPRKMEHVPDMESPAKLPRIFWPYVLAGALIAAGYADFPLIALHIERFAGVSDGWVPVMYAIVMASDGLSALAFGRSYDRVGLLPLICVLAAVPLFVFLIFSSDVTFVILGMILYGVGFGAQDSVMRAVVADMTPAGRRGTAFGIYNAAFGISWFLGSIAMGALYESAMAGMMFLSISLQLMAIPVMVHVMRGHVFASHRKSAEAAEG